MSVRGMMAKKALQGAMSEEDEVAMAERHAAVICSMTQNRGDSEISLCVLVKTKTTGRGVWRVIAERVDGTMLH